MLRAVPVNGGKNGRGRQNEKDMFIQKMSFAMPLQTQGHWFLMVSKIRLVIMKTTELEYHTKQSVKHGEGMLKHKKPFSMNGNMGHNCIVANLTKLLIYMGFKLLKT